MTFLYVFRIHSSGADQQPLDTIGLVDAVLMSVTAVESSYEPVIANKLIGKCCRAFYTIRYSRDENEVDPDFVLLDCERGEVSIKVFGRSDETHLAGEKEKVAFYGRTFEVTGR